MSDNYTLREAVVQYLTDTALTAGVDAILSSASKLPADLSFRELPLYYEALWSARQVQCEVALDLCEIWERIWGTAIATAGIKLAEPGEARNWLDCNLHPETIWEELEMVRCATEDDYTFWVSLTAEGIACGCYLGKLRHPDGLSWIGDYANSKSIPITKDCEIDLGELVRIAQQVPGILKEATESKAAAARPSNRRIRARGR